MNSIKFIVEGEPKALKRHRDKRPVKSKTGKWFTPKYDPSSADKEVFLAMCKQYRPDFPIEDTPVLLKVCFYFSAPKSKKDAEMRHTKRPDVDNLVKFVLDSLNGTFWKDDCIVFWIESKKLYTIAGRPRTEIEIIY